MIPGVTDDPRRIFMKVGERNSMLARLFNVREGFTPEDDVLPQRLHEGAGWDPQAGRRTPAKLAELGVETATT